MLVKPIKNRALCWAPHGFFPAIWPRNVSDCSIVWERRTKGCMSARNSLPELCLFSPWVHLGNDRAARISVQSVWIFKCQPCTEWNSLFFLITPSILSFYKCTWSGTKKNTRKSKQANKQTNKIGLTVKSDCQLRAMRSAIWLTGIQKIKNPFQDHFHYILTTAKNGFVFLLSATGKTEKAQESLMPETV